MKMGYRRIAGSVFITFAFAWHAHADGYRNPPPTAESIGKSGVNSAFVDDASAISLNPANLAMQTNASYVASLTLARTENQFSPAPVFNFESDADWFLLPNIYYSQPLGDTGVALGLGITSPYGQGISWNPSDFAAFVTAEPVPYEANLVFININPTVAFALNDSIYIGLGLDVAYSELELKALFPPGVPPTPATADGDGWGIGGNAGLTWLPVENQRITITYRSGVDIDYEGDFSLGGDFETTVKYPNSFGIGYGIELTEDIRVEALLEWLEWSVNDVQTLVIGSIPSQLQNNWDDTVTFGVGTDWQVDEKWVVRAGYAFIETPIPDSTITPLLPDADRHALSLGAGYTAGKHTVDVAYTFSIYDDRSGTATGSYDIDSNLIGMTYSYSF